MDTRTCRTRTTGRAFTLIELMIVIGLIGILVTLVVSVGSAVRAKAAENQTRAVLKAVQGAIEAYADTYRTVPN
ncbi:MAG: type II secretion system protein, partial [Planctomycetes bacterium]|nr:type II secretion system protein [Planctomycetota bacterium]